MPADSPANNGTLFRLALLAMLLSLWLIGRASLRQEIVEEADDAAVLERPEQDDPVTVVVVPPVEVPADAPGGVEGIVKFVGIIKEPPPLILSSDPYCANLYAGRESLLQESRVWGENRTLQNVLIYVTAGLPQRDWVVPTETAVIQLHECRVEPHITALQFGQLVEVHNLDPNLHVPRIEPADDAGIEMSMSPQGPPMVWMPLKPEIGVYMKCGIKSWMSGYIHVIEHPYFAVTGPRGTYNISNLPPGEYELTLWHEVKTFRESVKPVKVKIEPGKITKIDFTIDQKSRSVE